MQLAERYNALLQEISQAADKAHRAPQSVRLLAVSKGRPVEAIAELQALGQRDFAENYVQEAIAKQDELRAFDLIWHFIGRIQSRAIKAIASRFSWVHTVVNEKEIVRLERARAETGLPPLQVCLQVNISEDPQKNGIKPAEAPFLCNVLRSSNHLELRGLMTILQDYLSPTEIQENYARLKGLLAVLQDQGYPLDTLSMGMSRDFALAIAEGASWVRVGRALFD